ncbi:12595_t:CDS:2 [Ambispora gerdemannii]|uniref:12595_t:CDS:1 n=1 Tax=Ambispora gerdemannii TaxID=144530 RepID=A0A9N8V7W1_9GLOM|nr:12595_t:CDS:2 [Ambispora gerdemannii]
MTSYAQIAEISHVAFIYGHFDSENVCDPPDETTEEKRKTSSTGRRVVPMARISESTWTPLNGTPYQMIPKGIEPFHRSDYMKKP